MKFNDPWLAGPTPIWAYFKPIICLLTQQCNLKSHLNKTEHVQTSKRRELSIQGVRALTDKSFTLITKSWKGFKNYNNANTNQIFMENQLINQKTNKKKI